MKNHNFFLYRTSEKSIFAEAKSLGFGQAIDRELDWHKQVKKIEHYDFSKVLMLWPRSKEDWRAFELIKHREVTLVSRPSLYRDESRMLNHRFLLRTLLLIACDKELAIMMDDPEKFQNVDILILGHKAFRPSAKSLNSLGHPIYFYFPLKENLIDKKLSTRMIKNYALSLKSSGVEMRPYPGLLYYEKRAPLDLEFYPLVTPRLQKREGEVFDSIVIPVYNQSRELEGTLRQLAHQRYSKRFEVIIVDDGSSDRILETIESTLLPLRENPQIDFTYIRQNRVYPRQMGDCRFRAGISRNLGLSFCRGEIIHFIDADILVSSDYLKTMNTDLEEADLIQSQRYDLRFDKGRGGDIENWNEVQWERDIDLKFNPYWYDFFFQVNDGDDWNKLRAPWKYICTYGLSIKRELLEAVGLIRPNYIFYGFEDTDLGYQLYKKGASFKLSSEVVYHRPHPVKRSEFKNSNSQRNHILSKTAPVFFLNNLDPAIYTELGDFIIPHYSPWQWPLYGLSLLSFGLFDRPLKKWA